LIQNIWGHCFRPSAGDSDHSGRGHSEDRQATPEPAEEKPRPSIFGSAKPVDTTAREKEIEERLRKKSEEKHDAENGER
jgi:hypothetical protein